MIGVLVPESSEGYAVEPPNLGLLVYAQEQGTIVWVHKQAHSVAYVLEEQGVGRPLESVAAVRSQTERVPNAGDRHEAEPGNLGQGARALMRVSPRCAFQGLNHHQLPPGHPLPCRRERHLPTIPSEPRILRATVESLGAGRHHPRAPSDGLSVAEGPAGNENGQHRTQHCRQDTRWEKGRLGSHGQLLARLRAGNVEDST